MNSSDPAVSDPAVAAALRALERRVRWLTALCVFLSIGWALLVAQRWLRSPVVSAQRFVVQDAGGHVRAEMGVNGGNEPVLRLNNAAGKERVLMGLRPDGTIEMRLTDHRHEHRASLFLNGDGWPALVLSAPDGRSLVRVDTGSEGGSIGLFDADGRRTWSAP
jgi:hypothetical protein